METFITEDFMLKSETAKKLFEQVKNIPIIDYHCHLNPKEIAENKRFKNITELWLYGDWTVVKKKDTKIRIKLFLMDKLLRKNHKCEIKANSFSSGDMKLLAE